MQVTHPDGGVGVTIYSDYPDSDGYYRLRRYRGSAFHLSPHGSSGACVGSTETDVRPSALRWYQFRIQAFAEDSGVRVRAKVWEQGQAEPDWQADCFHSAPHSSGFPGVWSMGPGEKYWDDLELIPLEVD